MTKRVKFVLNWTETERGLSDDVDEELVKRLSVELVSVFFPDRRSLIHPEGQTSRRPTRAEIISALAMALEGALGLASPTTARDWIKQIHGPVLRPVSMTINGVVAGRSATLLISPGPA